MPVSAYGPMRRPSRLKYQRRLFVDLDDRRQSTDNDGMVRLGLVAASGATRMRGATDASKRVAAATGRMEDQRDSGERKVQDIDEREGTYQKWLKGV